MNIPAIAPMISILIKSAVVLTVAAVIATSLRRQSAALRHAIWTAGLLGALLVPLCSLTMPSWSSGLVGKIESYFQTPEPGALSSVSPGAVETAAAVAPQVTVGSSPSAPVSAPVVPARNWSLVNIAIAVWLVGAAFGLLLMLFGALRLAWVAIRAVPMTDPRWLNLAEEVRRSLGFRRPVRLLQSPSSRFLGTWGIMVPRVLLPFDAGQWTDERAWMVLGHELAHIQRHDWAVQVLAEAARAIYWFNPVFWLAYSRLRRESEQACDDTVIRLGAVGTQYAEELLDLARSLRSENRMKSPILAMAQPSHLERRLVAVLDPALNRLAATPWSVIVVALVAVALTLPLAAVRAPERVRTPMDSVAPPLSLPLVAKSTPVPNLKAPSPTLAADTVAPPTPELPKVELPATVSSPIELPPDLRASGANTKALPSSVGRVNATPPPLPYECRVTPSVVEIKMKEAKSALGSGPWRINDDRTIWTWDTPYIAGTSVNTMWMKPANEDLSINGRRLDGDSAPLQARVAKDSTAGYIASSLLFPNPGCWEVTASAGSSTLRFITRVEAQ